jgi:hypothetical protein
MDPFTFIWNPLGTHRALREPVDAPGVVEQTALAGSLASVRQLVLAILICETPERTDLAF